jgi:hypothetical protein
MLIAYLDESGTHTQSEVVMIAGFLALSTLWSAFDADWSAALAEFSVPYFHATERDAARGAFNSMERPVREALFNRVSRVIATHKPTAINVAVSRLHWEADRARNPNAIYSDPYHGCFEFGLQQISLWLGPEAADSVALVVEEQREYEATARRLFELYKGSAKWGTGLASLTFASSKGLPGLQAADLLVYEKTRHEREKLKRPDAALRASVDLLGDADVQAIDYPFDEQALRQIIAGSQSSDAVTGERRLK